MKNIVLCGFMGCGKTTVGHALAKRLGLRLVDTDEVITQKAEMEIKDIFAKEGEEYFRDLEHEVCRQLAEEQGLIISTGGGALTFERNAEAFKNDSVVFIHCPFEIIKKRIEGDPSRPLMNDNAENLYNQRLAKYKSAADFTVDGSREINSVVNEILEFIK